MNCNSYSASSMLSFLILVQYKLKCGMSFITCMSWCLSYHGLIHKLSLYHDQWVPKVDGVMSKNLTQYLMVGHANSIQYIFESPLPHTLDTRIVWQRTMNEHDVICTKNEGCCVSVMAKSSWNMTSFYLCTRVSNTMSCVH